MCDKKKEEKEMPTVTINKSQSQALLNVRRIMQEQMKKKGLRYEDVLKMIKSDKNDR